MLLDLNKFSIGNKQTVGIMSVYPLIAEDEKTNLAMFEDIKFNGTINYGQMSFTNNSDNVFILPTGYSIMTKQAAQDHALTFASLLRPKENKVFENACCIQQTQGGYIKGEDNMEFSILPLYIRKQVLKNFRVSNNDYDNYNDFSRLWDDIRNFQQDLIKRSEGNLIYFFNKYLDRLATFNAEFECVPNQRGAIISINNKVIGIEVVPTHEYWSKIWSSLIRDCYGSEVLRLTELKIIKTFKDSMKNKLDLSKCSNVSDIKNVLEDLKNKETEEAIEILKDISNIKFTKQSHKALDKQNSFNDLKYSVIKGKGTVGEFYRENENLIYLSLLF